jgi:Retinal tissue protein
LFEWLQETLSVERLRRMTENIERLSEGQLIQKAKEIELLALKLDIEQANEISRGKEFNIIKKS